MIKDESFRQRILKLKQKKDLSQSESSLPPFPDSPRPINVVKTVKKTQTIKIKEDDKKEKGIIDSIYRFFSWK